MKSMFLSVGARSCGSGYAAQSNNGSRKKVKQRTCHCKGKGESHTHTISPFSWSSTGFGQWNVETERDHELDGRKEMYSRFGITCKPPLQIKTFSNWADLPGLPLQFWKFPGTKGVDLTHSLSVILRSKRLSWSRLSHQLLCVCIVQLQANGQ